MDCMSATDGGDGSGKGRRVLNEELVRELYHGRGMTQQEVAAEAGVTQSAVSSFMRYHDIPRREFSHPAEVPPSELAADVRRVARETGRRPTFSSYGEHGEYGHTTVIRKLGDGVWSDALDEALRDG